MKPATINMDAVAAAPHEITPNTSVDLTAGLGSAMKRMRKLKGMTQAELAVKVGLERTSITNIEAGNQKLTVLALCSFADALGVDVRITFSDRNGQLKDAP